MNVNQQVSISTWRQFTCRYYLMFVFLFFYRSNNPIQVRYRINVLRFQSNVNTDKPFLQQILRLTFATNKLQKLSFLLNLGR